MASQAFVLASQVCLGSFFGSPGLLHWLTVWLRFVMVWLVGVAACLRTLLVWLLSLGVWLDVWLVWLVFGL